MPRDPGATPRDVKNLLGKFAKEARETLELHPGQLRYYVLSAYRESGPDPDILIQDRDEKSARPIHEISPLVRSIRGTYFCRVYFPNQKIFAEKREAITKLEQTFCAPCGAALAVRHLCQALVLLPAARLHNFKVRLLGFTPP